MKKIFILLLVFTSFTFADKLKAIQTLDDIPKNKDVILVFSMKYCPYCSMQERSLLNRVKPKFPNIVYLKVLNNTKLYSKLIQTGNFGEVDAFPTTFILKKDSEGELDVKYPFVGFQRSTAILSILKDDDIMED